MPIVAEKRIHREIARSGVEAWRASGPEEAEALALRLLARGRPVVAVYRGSWERLPLVEREATLRGLNPLLYMPLDPLEAAVHAGKDLAGLAVARLRLLSEGGAASAPSYVDPEKPVYRRAFLTRPHQAAFRYVPGPVLRDPWACAGLGRCTRCVEECPHGALAGKPPRLSPDRCTSCGLCVWQCPVEALVLPGLGPEAYRRFLDSVRPLEGSGWLVAVCRGSMPDMSRALEDLAGAPPGHPVVFLPVPCPGWLGEARSLEALSRGLAPIHACTSGSLEACGGPDLVLRGLKGLRSLGILRMAREPGELARMARAQPPERPGRSVAIEPLKPRSGVASLLSGLAQERVSFAEPVIGLAIVDRERCTLCEACAHACPTGALRIAQQGAETQLLFEPAACAACRLCEEACPHEAIRVEYAYEPGGTRVLATAGVARCRRCGRPIGPLAMIKALEERLRRSGAPRALIDQIWLCEDCKRGARRENR